MLRKLSSAAIILAGLTVQAQAGVSPPVISGTYYEQNGTQGCTTSGSSGQSSGESSGAPGSVIVCQVLFQAPPAGKQIALDSVACQLRYYSSDGAAVKDAYLAQNVNGAVVRKRLLLVAFQATEGSYSYSTIDDVLDGSYLVVAPVRIVMDVTMPTALSMDCQISGTLRSTPTP